MTATQQQTLALLIAAALQERLEQTRFGLLARNMPQFEPQLLYGAMQTALDAGELRLALVGYTVSEPFNPEHVTFDVEQAVAWRNDNSVTPIVAILNPLKAQEKIHSLEMLEPFTDADLRHSIVQRGIDESTSQTEKVFWRTLKRKNVSGRLALVAERVAQLYISWKQGTAIEEALPHIGLLRDPLLFATDEVLKDIDKRLKENSKKVEQLRSLTKKDYRALGRALGHEQNAFQNTFLAVQAFTQYPRFATLNVEALSLPAVEALFKAPKAPETKEGSDTPPAETPSDSTADRELLNWMFSQDEKQRQQLNEFADAINDLFEENPNSDQEPDWEEKESKTASTNTPDGREATVTYPEKQQRHCLETVMRQAVQNDVWGGILDAQDLDPNLSVPQLFTGSVTLPPLQPFKPLQLTALDDEHGASLITLFDALDQAQSGAEPLSPLFKDLHQKRQALTSHRIRFLYLPNESAQYILPTSSETLLKQISDYIEVYEQLAARLQTLYRQLFDLYPDTIKQATAQFLALDTIVILRPVDPDPNVRRGGHAVVLTTLHPLYLWKWLELAQRMRQHAEPLSEAETNFLQKRLLRLPTVLNTFMLYPAMLPSAHAVAYQEGDEVRMVLAGDLDQPRNERTAGVPYYQEKPELSLNSDGLPRDQLRDLLKGFLALYPPARVGISIAVVNPPVLKPLLDACHRLADESLLCGAHIHVFYSNEQVDLYESRLFDDDDVVERFRNNIHWIITTSAHPNYEKLIQAIREQFFHITLLYNPSEAVVQPVLRTTRAQTSPFSIPLQLTYDPIRDIVRRVPAPVGGIFDVYTGLRNAVSNELSHRTYGVGRRPIKDQELRALAAQSAWLIMLDHINGTLEQPISDALWLWQPVGTQTLTVSSQDRRWHTHLDDLVHSFSVPWPRDSIERYVREIVSLVPQGLLSTVQTPENDEAAMVSNVARGEAFQNLLAIVGALYHYRNQHPNAVLIPSQALVGIEQPKKPIWLVIWHEEERMYIDIVAAQIILVPEQLPDLSTEKKVLSLLEAIARALESLFDSQADNTLFGPLRREMLRDYLSVAVFATTSHNLASEERKQRASLKASWADVINKLFTYLPQIRLRSIRILVEGRPLSLQTLDFDSYRREVVTLSAEMFGKAEPQEAQSLVELAATQPDEPTVVHVSTDMTSHSAENVVDGTEEQGSDPAGEASYPDAEPLEEQAQRLRRALVAYGIAVAEVDTQRTQVGPRIVRFWVRLQPPAGRLSEVQKYIVDIARELGSKTIPLVDNIPGEQYIRIDLPREHPQNVPLADGLVELPHEQPFSLLLATGVNAAGERVQHDLVRMPHLLVAGTTGSGKTMFLSTLITSLALRHAPTDLQLMLV